MSLVALAIGAIVKPTAGEAFDWKETGLRVVRAITATFGAGSPAAFGIVADYGFFDERYLVLAAIAAGKFLLTIRMPAK